VRSDKSDLSEDEVMSDDVRSVDVSECKSDFSLDNRVRFNSPILALSPMKHLSPMRIGHTSPRSCAP
jgi:hypothetical protein